MLLICMCAVGLLVRARRTGGLGGGGGVRRPSPRGRDGRGGATESETRERTPDCREGGARARGAAARARDRARRATRGELAR